ncbi:hemin uptake protein HemP [Serratia ficaria]|uniref:Hemin uptake protein n=2 Tax=Serratia TaxID=613 RepID=A0A240C0Z9_SERFI|nr:MULTISPECIES: hemin uptake protein HemP [Serratia]MEE4484488.1 hemin uptake protein HemP [Serratia ficaria]REF44988.1 hemin uptake protein hemP [Serratia ficaria]CAI0736814.1 Hemin uptake protein [Serratia ficaria]CAI0770831.1 Hemin uptake protein [Serratia ficaria]CAI0846078.1 Hemin uptake protein [Serratia ficaria]
MTMDNPNNNLPAAGVPAGRSAEPHPCYDSAQLLGADGVAVITHQGQRYQLRQTKAGKLILTK